MSSTHRHLLLDFFWQVISGPPCIIHVISTEQALNSLIPEKSKGRYLSEIIETFKQRQDLNKVTIVNESDVGVFS
jgi:hypothetical protein